MRPRLRAILGCLVLAFAFAFALAAMPPALHAQSEAISLSAATSKPTDNYDAKPFPRGDAASISRTSSTSQPTRGTSADLSSLGFDMGRMLAALLIVLALIGLVYWAAKRIAGRHTGAMSTRAVKVLSRTAIAPRQQVVLVQVGRRVIVVGESAGQLASLAQIDDADEVAQLLGQIEGEQMRKAVSFGGVFRQSQTSFDETSEPHSGMHPPSDEPTAEVSDLDRQRSEISGLLDKVRALRGQIDK